MIACSRATDSAVGDLKSANSYTAFLKFSWLRVLSAPAPLLTWFGVGEFVVMEHGIHVWQHLLHEAPGNERRPGQTKILGMSLNSRRSSRNELRARFLTG